MIHQTPERNIKSMLREFVFSWQTKETKILKTSNAEGKATLGIFKLKCGVTKYTNSRVYMCLHSLEFLEIFN